MRAVALVTAVVSVSCASGASPKGPTSTIATPPKLTFAAPATSYNEPWGPPPSTQLGDLIVEYARAAAHAAGRQPPVADERLFLASYALASVVPEEGVVPYPFVEFALRSSGVIEPTPHLLVLWGQLDGPRAPLLESLRPALVEVFRNVDVARIGVGAVIRGRNGYGALVVTLLSSRIRTSPIARSIAVDASLEVAFTIEDDGAPLAEVMRPDGNVDDFPLQRKADGSFIASIDCGGTAGKMNVSIEADSRSGFETVANFPVWCGEEPPRTFTISPTAPPTPSDPLDAERLLYAMLNTERKRLGRTPLHWDPGLATAAREHSRAMRGARLVAQTLLGERSTLSARVAAHRQDLALASYVARTYGLDETHRGLLELPTTRRGLVSEDATLIGIGIEYGDEIYSGVRELYVTEIVARPRDASSHERVLAKPGKPE